MNIDPDELEDIAGDLIDVVTDLRLVEPNDLIERGRAFAEARDRLRRIRDALTVIERGTS